MKVRTKQFFNLSKLTVFSIVLVFACSVLFVTTEQIFAAAKPGKVTGITAKATKSSITVKWKKPSGAKGYQVYRATGTSDKFTKVKTIKSAKTLKYVDNSVKAGTKYTYKVRAYNGKKTGSFSKAVSGKVPATDPGDSDADPSNPSGEMTFTEHTEVTLDYGSTTIHLGQTWSDAVYQALRSGSSGEEIVTRANSDRYYKNANGKVTDKKNLTQTVYMFDVADYSDFLMVYVTNNQIVRWLSNSNMGKNGTATFKLGDADIPEKGYSGYKNANAWGKSDKYLNMNFPALGVFLGGFTLNTDDNYWWCYRQRYANVDGNPDETLNITENKRIAIHYINALRHVCGGGEPYIYCDILDGTGKTFTGTLSEGWWWNTDYSLGVGDLELKNQVYGEQAWAETMHASKHLSHTDNSYITSGPLAGKKYIDSSVISYIMHNSGLPTGLGEVCRGSLPIGEDVVHYGNSAGHHAFLVDTEGFTHMGIGISGQYSGIMFAMPYIEY